VMIMRGHTCAFAWRSIIERGLSSPLQPWDEAACNASIILRAVVLGDRDRETQPQFITVSAGAKREILESLLLLLQVYGRMHCASYRLFFVGGM
jgi:hypothetical protein